jgi:hypothetical protein
MPDTRQADPAARGTATRIVLALGICGGTAIWLLGTHREAVQSWFEGMLAATPNAAVVLAIAVAAPVFGLAIYFFAVGWKIARERHYPPRGYRLIRDAHVLEDDAAVRRGRWLQGLASMLLAVAFALSYLAWQLVAFATPH